METQKCLVIRTLLALAQPSLGFSRSKGRAGYLGISGFPSVTFCEAASGLASFIKWILAVYSEASRPLLSPRWCVLYVLGHIVCKLLQRETSTMFVGN